MRRILMIEGLQIDITVEEGKVVSIALFPDFIDEEFQKKLNPESEEELENLHILNLAERELGEYIKGERKEFTFPVYQTGTPFRMRVWEELMKIPCGDRVTYGELAERIGRPEAVRAVANAVGANRIAIVVPCHRVVGKNNIGGYHWGEDIKRRLLNLEKSS